VVYCNGRGVSARICSTLSRCCAGAPQAKPPFGRSHIDVNIALVFIGKKLEGNRLPKKIRPQTLRNRKRSLSLRRFFLRIQTATTKRTYPVRDHVQTHAIEPIEESVEQPLASAFLGRSSKAASAGLRVRALKCLREETEICDGHGELLVEPPS